MSFLTPSAIQKVRRVSIVWEHQYHHSKRIRDISIMNPTDSVWAPFVTMTGDQINQYPLIPIYSEEQSISLNPVLQWGHGSARMSFDTRLVNLNRHVEEGLPTSLTRNETGCCIKPALLATQPPCSTFAIVLGQHFHGDDFSECHKLTPCIIYNTAGVRLGDISDMTKQLWRSRVREREKSWHLFGMGAGIRGRKNPDYLSS